MGDREGINEVDEVERRRNEREGLEGEGSGREQ